MEGGLLPWRSQIVVNDCPDITKATTKSLPPPPSGFFWERNDSGEWALLEMPRAKAEDGALSFERPSILEHTVMPGDTLQGICLRYRVSATDLRRANLFSGNSIAFKASLIIPINGGAIVQPQIETHEVILQRFKNLTSKGAQEARLYLEDNEWNLAQALVAWKNDQHWEGEHKDHIKKDFSTDVPDEEEVAPIAVEIPPQVAPAKISLVPPIFEELYFRNQQGRKTYFDIDSTDPAAEPFL